MGERFPKTNDREPKTTLPTPPVPPTPPPHYGIEPDPTSRAQMRLAGHRGETPYTHRYLQGEEGLADDYYGKYTKGKQPPGINTGLYGLGESSTAKKIIDEYNDSTKGDNGTGGSSGPGTKGGHGGTDGSQTLADAGVGGGLGGGLGEGSSFMDALKSIPIWVWIALAAVVGYFLFKKGKK
jgi:hypothetical protein